MDKVQSRRILGYYLSAYQCACSRWDSSREYADMLLYSAARSSLGRDIPFVIDSLGGMAGEW